MKKKLLLTLLLCILVLPTIVAAQSEEDTTTTQWTDIYAFKEVAIASGQPVDYDFSYNAPYDRALGDVGYAVSSATLEEIMVVADIPIPLSNSAIDVEVILLDLEQQYSFLNMLSGQQEIITLNVDYENADNEQASIIVTPKYAPAEGEEIGAKLIFVWELTWQRSTQLDLRVVLIFAGVGIGILYLLRKGNWD